MKHNNNTITVEGYTFTKYTDGTEVYFVSPHYRGTHSNDKTLHFRTVHHHTNQPHPGIH